MQKPTLQRVKIRATARPRILLPRGFTIYWSEDDGAGMEQAVDALRPPLPGRQVKRCGAVPVLVPHVHEPREAPASEASKRHVIFMMHKDEDDELASTGRSSCPVTLAHHTMSRPQARSWRPRGWLGGSRHDRSRPRGGGMSARVPSRTSGSEQAISSVRQEQERDPSPIDCPMHSSIHDTVTMKRNKLKTSSKF